MRINYLELTKMLILRLIENNSGLSPILKILSISRFQKNYLIQLLRWNVTVNEKYLERSKNCTMQMINL